MTKQKDREDDRNHLCAVLKPGDTVYCVLRSVSRSGMNRKISFFILRDGEITGITCPMAAVLGLRLVSLRGTPALSINGCGMDMGFHTIYALGRALFPQGYIPAEAGKDYGRNGLGADVRDPDGGYALTSRWL